MHVEVFGADRVVLVPAGMGVMPPVRRSPGRVSSAGCYGGLVTLEPTGVVLVRPGSRLTLSDLFRAWGVPLAMRQLASFRAPTDGDVAVFVDGHRWRGEPGRVRLSRHAEIVLEGLFATGHPGGLIGIFGYGGWWSLPAALAVGLVLAALFHGARWVLREVAERHRCPIAAPRRGSSTARAPRDWVLPPLEPLADGWSDRGPPR